MQTSLTDKELRILMDRLKQDLKTFVEENSLDLQFESAAKHIPAYLKIVKGHITQLAQVLELETHDHRNLDSVGLAEPVIQLMQLFRDLDENDIQLIETLAYEAHNWQADSELETVEKEPKRLATEA